MRRVSQGWVALISLLSVVVTAVVAPVVVERVKARHGREERRAEVQERKDEATAKSADALAKRVDDRIDALLEEHTRERIALREDLTRKDVRIGELERQVDELRREVIGYRLGMAAPKGFVVVPLPLWERIRRDHGDQIGGHFAGEPEMRADLATVVPPDAEE